MRSHSYLAPGSTILAILGCFNGQELHGQTILTANLQSDQLRTVNIVSGQTLSEVTITLPGQAVSGVDALAYHPNSQQLFAILNTGLGSQVLVTLDATSGGAIPIGPTGPSLSSMAFDSLGVLHAVSETFGLSEDFVSIDLQSGQVTPLLVLDNFLDQSTGFCCGSGECLGFNRDDGLFYRLTGSPVSEPVIFQSVNPGANAVVTVPLSGLPGTYDWFTDMDYLGGDLFLAADFGDTTNASLLYLITTEGVVSFLAALESFTTSIAVDCSSQACAISSLYSEYCQGDGGDQVGCTDCPCGNNAPAGGAGGCINSSGESARLLATGSASVSLPADSAADLRFVLTGAPPAVFCILSSGASVAPQNPLSPCFGQETGIQAVAFDGLRCVVQSVRRHGSRSTDATGRVGASTPAWGGEAAPLGGLAVASGVSAGGQTRFFQAIYRDNPLAVCMRGLGTSQAVEIQFTP